MAATIGVAQSTEFARFQQLGAAISLWLTSTAFADLFITAFLVNFLVRCLLVFSPFCLNYSSPPLHQWTNKTGFQTQTDSVTDKIIAFTVKTGGITSIGAIANVLLFCIIPVSVSSVATEVAWTLLILRIAI
jgi:hypothetical protein